MSGNFKKNQLVFAGRCVSPVCIYQMLDPFGARWNYSLGTDGGFTYTLSLEVDMRGVPPAVVTEVLGMVEAISEAYPISGDAGVMLQTLKEAGIADNDDGAPMRAAFNVFYKSGDEAACERFFASAPHPQDWLKTEAGEEFLAAHRGLAQKDLDEKKREQLERKLDKMNPNPRDIAGEISLAKD